MSKIDQHVTVTGNVDCRNTQFNTSTVKQENYVRQGFPAILTRLFKKGSAQLFKPNQGNEIIGIPIFSQCLFCHMLRYPKKFVMLLPISEQIINIEVQPSGLTWLAPL